MQLIVLESKANQTGVDTTNIDNVSVNFRITELFENVNSPVHDCSIKVLYSAYSAAVTPDAQAALVQNDLVNEINSGQLVISWSGCKYNRTGTTIDTVDISFKTYDTGPGNTIVIEDSLNIPYSQFQTDMNSGIDGLISDVKTHLISEFTPAAG